MSDPQHWFGSTVAAGCEVLVQCELFLLVLSARRHRSGLAVGCVSRPLAASGICSELYRSHTRAVSSTVAGWTRKQSAHI